MTGSIFGYPLYTGTTIQEIGQKPLIQKRGQKREKVKKELKVKVAFLSARKKKAVNSREALYNSG